MTCSESPRAGILLDSSQVRGIPESLAGPVFAVSQTWRERGGEKTGRGGVRAGEGLR